MAKHVIGPEAGEVARLRLQLMGLEQENAQLRGLLRQVRRSHDRWCLIDTEVAVKRDEWARYSCTCGAAGWNAPIDAALRGPE